MSNPPRSTPSGHVRDIEMRLFEEIGTQLKGVSESMKDLTLEMRDVRERLIRIEAQDQPKKIAELETDVREAFDEITRVEKALSDELAKLQAHSVSEITRIEKDFNDIKAKLEQRLQRMEIIIAPLTVGGSAFLAAVMGAIVTAMMSGKLGG